MQVNLSCAVVGLVVLFAAGSLMIFFTTDAAISGFAVGQFSLHTCAPPKNFVAQFSSRNECRMNVLRVCQETCPKGVKACVGIARRWCDNFGQSFVLPLGKPFG